MRLQQTTTNDQYTSGVAGAGTRITWPDAVAYRESIQTPHLSLSDPMLQTCGIQLDRRGLPVAYAGRFAIVFRLVGENGDVWALRCFTTPGDQSGANRSMRYQLVQKYVDEHRNIFVPFRYIERGIKIGKNWYPTLAMRWASGEPLGRWVESHRHDQEALRRLCGTLTDLLVRLESAGIAHGDWQHDNLLVADDGRRVTLVDYDGMFVPELAGHPAVELGHPNYQHPARTSEHFGVGLDRFACLVMQTALLALAQEPSLWDRYSDGESLLFKREDLISPESSPLFQELRAIAELTSDETLADAIARLSDACHAGAMSSLLPVVEATEGANEVVTPTYAPMPAGTLWQAWGTERVTPTTAQTQTSAGAVSGRLNTSGAVGPWWMVPETVTRTAPQPAQIMTPQPRRQVTALAKDSFTFIERAESQETARSEQRHLLNWRLGAVGMLMLVIFIITVSVSLQNPFLPIYFAWLLAYASLGYEKWPRRIIYEELKAEISKMEAQIADRKAKILALGGTTHGTSGGVTTVGEYITERLRQTSINRVLAIPGIRATTLRVLQSAGLNNALDLKNNSPVDGVAGPQLIAIQNWIRELEAEAAVEYRKTVGVARGKPGEISRHQHEMAEFERHAALLRRELALFPDTSHTTYLRKLTGQADSATTSPTSTP